MKYLFSLFLPFLFVATWAPGQVYACGDSGCKDVVQEQPVTKQQASEKACCKNSGSSSCCEKDGAGQPDDHGCNGHCGGKCGGHCTCPTVHAGAVFFGDFDLRFPPSQPVFTSYSYIAPFLSSVSLDIWLPPDIRA